MAKNDPFNSSLGARLRQSRLLRRYTAERLAEAAGLCTSYVSDIERGQKCPSCKVMADLSQSLEVSCDYLILGRRPVLSLYTDSLSAAELALLEQLLIPLIPVVRAACRNG